MQSDLNLRWVYMSKDTFSDVKSRIKKMYTWSVRSTKCLCVSKNTVITLSIGTDRPLQTVDPEQMLQNVVFFQGLQC